MPQRRFSEDITSVDTEGDSLREADVGASDMENLTHAQRREASRNQPSNTFGVTLFVVFA